MFTKEVKSASIAAGAPPGGPMDLLETLARVVAGWTLLSLAVGFGWSRFMGSQNDPDEVADDAAADVPPDLAAFAHL